MVCYLEQLFFPPNTDGVIVAKERIRVLREQNESRRHSFQAQREGLKERRDLEKEIIQKEIRRTNQKWNAVQIKTAEARSFLCNHAALLYSLREKKKKGGTVEYFIGCNPIPSLYELASKYAHILLLCID